MLLICRLECIWGRSSSTWDWNNSAGKLDCDFYHGTCSAAHWEIHTSPSLWHSVRKWPVLPVAKGVSVIDQVIPSSRRVTENSWSCTDVWHAVGIAASRLFRGILFYQNNSIPSSRWGGLPILLKSFAFGLLAKIPQKATLGTVTLVIQILFQ